jgi:L-seryl-tRNA(Ser) seleniumtransferase
MVGSSAFIEAARQNGAPYQRWARALKVGKEEIVGLTAAVERFVKLDHAAMRQQSQADCEAWVAALAGLAGVETNIEATNEAGQSLPRVHVTVTRPADVARMVTFFDAATPRLAVYPDAPLGAVRGFWVTPELVERQHVEYVVETIRRAHAASIR